MIYKNAEFEKRLLKPEIRTSPDELNRILADDFFFEYGSSGLIFYKSDCVGESGISVYQMTLSHFDIHRLSPDVAMTTYRVLEETRIGRR